MNSIVEDILMHYGMPRRSGRYPYGSGENPYQHSGDFLSRVQELKKSGMSETDIAKNMGLTTTQLRTQMSLAKDERRALQVATAKGLREKGYSLNEIADKMGFANDSSVRSLLNETSENRMNQAKATADVLRKLIEEKGMIDVGTGVERELGVSKEKLNQALYMLELEGYVDKNGKIQVRTQKSTKMAETKDARTLSSGTPQEEAYADYANSMKSLANQARREMMSTGKIAYSASAKATYYEEVNSLNAKLDLALANAPRERQAQTMANATVAAKRKDNPDMTKAEVKKASQQALAQARSSVGAKRSNIEITDKEWEAIQAGAISENKLTQILNNTNTDTIRQRATPRASTALSTAKQNRIAALSASGYSTSEIAEALGVSSSTVSKYLNGKE